MGPIVIATSNPHKVEELRAIFGGASHGGPEFIGLEEAAAREPARSAGLHEPEETGATFEQNAAIKALSYARQTGHTCLADDSGLEIDALGGRPGVTSSHYCTDGRETGMTRAERDRANNDRVLRELAGVLPEVRTARFVCVMVLAAPDGQVLARTRGTFEGRIGLETEVPRGGHGFGYDPLFLVAPDFRRTSAELPPQEKNAQSHRAKAAAEMGELLRSL
jgi:XTP/dITP diphosphohydrolase